MIVKNLINMLLQLDPNAAVCLEVLMDPSPNVVRQYTSSTGQTWVYIADDLAGLEGCFPDDVTIIDAKEVKT